MKSVIRNLLITGFEPNCAKNQIRSENLNNGVKSFDLSQLFCSRSISTNKAMSDVQMRN